MRKCSTDGTRCFLLPASFSKVENLDKISNPWVPLMCDPD